MKLLGTIIWPQVNLGSIMWPEIFALFFLDYAQEVVPDLAFYGAARIKTYHLKFLEQKYRKLSLIGLNFRVVPFLKYTFWKHILAKAAILWV